MHASIWNSASDGSDMVVVEEDGVVINVILMDRYTSMIRLKV